MIYDEIGALVAYGLEKGLIEEADAVWARNRMLDILSLDAYEPAGEKTGETLEEILKAILDDAAARGVIDGGITSRDLLDTRLMGVLTPLPQSLCRGPQGRDRLVLRPELRHGLYPPLPHREGPQVEGRDRIRRA